MDQTQNLLTFKDLRPKDMRTCWRVLILWFLASSTAPAAIPLGRPFVNERLHVRIRPPKGWLLAAKGLNKDEPVEFWKEDAYGPRIQILSYAFPVEMTDLEEAQKELSQTLLEQFPGLDIVEEKQLSHKGHPAIEVMATLEIEDTFYHVIQRCIFARARVFIITCASFESTFISDMPLFRASLDSIEILGDIYDPNFAGGRRGHLVRPSALGAGLAVFLVAGFILRRFSAARLRNRELGH
jgi:hypothetical protein